MKRLHAGAFVCFALATLFYLAAWLPGAIGLGVIGVFFEIGAWVFVFLGPDDAESSHKPPE
jgi:asparagine N-glycosylation enzyme membrane subunit Stt3